MKKIFIIAIILFFFSNSIHSKGRIYSSKFNYNYNEYVVFYDNYKLFNMEKMLVFARLFDTNLNKLCKKYKTEIPVNLKVKISMGSWIFKRLTGKDKNVGGLYDLRRNMFYFQNPGTLKRLGISKKVINHEVLHYILFKNRKTKRRLSNFWLEEVFAESIYPSIDYSSTYIKNPINFLTTYNQLRRFISNGTVSKNQKVRKRAYFAAYLWGTFLIKKFSKDYLFKVCTGEEDESNTKQVFKEFVKQ